MALLHQRRGPGTRRALAELSRAGSAAGRGDDLLLILDDCLLVPDDLDLIAEEQLEAILIAEDLLLVAYDRSLVSDDRQLILDCGLRHWVILLLGFNLL